MRRFTPRSIRSIPCFANIASRDPRPKPYYVGFARLAYVCFCNCLLRDPFSPAALRPTKPSDCDNPRPPFLPQQPSFRRVILVLCISCTTTHHPTTIAAYITSPPPRLRLLSLHPRMAIKSEAWLVLVTFRTLSSSWSMKYRCFLFVTGYIQRYQCRESLSCGLYSECSPDLRVQRNKMKFEYQIHLLFIKAV